MINCVIRTTSIDAKITGTYPLDVVKKATSYYKQGYQFTAAFKNKHWDGKHHFFNKQTESFPKGLVSAVEAALLAEDPDANISVIATTEVPKPIGPKDYTLHGIDFGKGVYDYQIEAADVLVEEEQGIAQMATNSGKTEVAAAVIKRIGLKSLFLVKHLTLLYQTRERFAKRLQIPVESIGIVGDSQYSIGAWITVATPQSLETKNTDWGQWDVVIADECHHVGGEIFYQTMRKITAPYRYGLSGTPLSRSDGADMRLVAVTGKVLYKVSNKFLVERGISVPPHVELVEVFTPPNVTGASYGAVEKMGITENSDLNAYIVARARELADKNKQVLVLVEKIKHGEVLAKGCCSPFVSGRDKMPRRLELLDQFTAGKIKILVACRIFDEGLDVPNIDVLVLAAGGKATIKLLQRVGRGLRSGADKDHLLIVDFAHYTHKWLLKHSLQRLKLYKKEDCFKITAAKVKIS